MTKNALVTGASGGIGYEFAKLLAQDGYNLILIARSEAKFFEIKQDFEEKYNVKILFIPIDLTIPDSAEEIFHILTQKKIDIDILVNNAGFGNYGEFIKTDIKNEAQMIRLNIMTLHQMTKFFLQKMVERKQGRIINVASIGAFQPGPLMSVFYATQSFILSFSEALAAELKGTGVTVTCFCPGPTESGFQTVAHLQESRIVKGRKLPSAEDVVKYGYEAMNKGKTIAINGLTNKFFAIIVRFLPRNFVARLVLYMHRKK